jgi:hydrophobic/amphiphilic exporter-1 (mainly G- bacteria), HAE1 family
MIRYFAQHPTAANIILLAVIVLGVTALPKLQRDTFPVIPATEVEIRVAYPGATPAEVEDSICQRIEDSLDAVTSLVEVRCDARENIAIATAEMHGAADMGTFYDDVKSQIDAISTFPTEAKTPSVVKLERTAMVASIAITGIEDGRMLKGYAEKVKNRIKRDRRIALVTVKGFSTQNIAIDIPEEALRRYRLGISDVTTAIERQSLDMPAGVMETPGGDWIVRFAGQRRAASQFKDLVVVSDKSGGRVFLGDIATIRTEFDRVEEKILFNGHRAALLEISKTENQDTLRVMEAIKKNLVREQAMAPKGVDLAISQDVTSNVRDRLRLLTQNGIMGLALVFLTMWAFFSLRFSFWVAMGLPVSFLGAIFAMHHLGYTINMITMVALLVAIGLLMDDAIVISENIAAQARKGKKVIDAVVDGTRQVLPGVFSSFITTILVVGPLAFMAGKMGAVLKYVPAVLMITLTVSLVEAFLILPAHLRHSLDKVDRNERNAVPRWVDAKFASLRDNLFGPWIDKATARPYLTVGTLIALALLSYATIPAGLLKYRAFPNLESDVIQARILLPQGTPLSRTEEVVDRVSAALTQLDDEFSERQSGWRRLVRNVTVQFNTNVNAYESGPHLATVSADLLRAEERDGTVAEMLDRWRTLVGEVPDVIAFKFTDKERGVAGKAIDVRLHGNNLGQLKKASLELQAWLRSFKGVLDLSDDLRPGKPEYRITLKDSAGIFGVTAQGVATEVRAAVKGSTSLEIRLGGETYDVVVSMSDRDLNGLHALRELTVTATNGRQVPLFAVAEVTETRGYARIHRVSGVRTITIQGTLDTDVTNARELMMAMKSKFMPQLKKKFRNIRFSSRGQDKETATTGNSLRTNLMIGLAGVFLVLAFQFRSYLQPLAVLLSMPMALIGVIWGHLLLGHELTMPSLVGLATLGGIVVNNNILLVTFIKERIADGMEVKDAVRNAARARFRAIMLTSLTTIAGLLPLLLETSTQAQFLIPLVVSLTFGLFSATVLALFMVPSLFLILKDLGLLGSASVIRPGGDSVPSA